MEVEQTLTNKTEQFQADRVATIAAAHAVHDTFAGFLPPLLPLLIEQFTLSKTQAGLLSVFTTAPSLLNPLVGYVADRLVLRWFVILCPAITAIAMSMLGIAPSYAVIAMLLLVVGFSSAVFHGTAPVMAGNLSGSRLGRGMSFWMVGGEFGRTFGPLLIVSAIQLLTFPGTTWLALLGIAISLVLFILLRNAPARAPHAPASLHWREALIRLRPVMAPLFIIILFRAFLSTGIGTYLPTYLRESGESLWTSGASLSLMEAAGVIGAMVGGSISDNTGRRPILLTTLLLTPILLIALVNTTGLLQLGVLALFGFFMLSTPPVIMAMVQEAVPENRALANGIYMMINFLAMTLSAIGNGVLADAIGLRGSFLTGAVLVFIAVPFIFFLPQKARASA